MSPMSLRRFKYALQTVQALSFRQRSRFMETRNIQLRLSSTSRSLKTATLKTMINTYTVQICKEIATRAHSLQVRNDGRAPYIKHVELVANLTKERMHKMRFDFRSICLGVSAAWLHDIVEDERHTGYGYQDLQREGVSFEVIELVKLLTKNKDYSYEDNIKRLIDNPIARVIKVSDNLANLSDFPSDSQIIKYSKSLTMLVSSYL